MQNRLIIALLALSILGATPALAKLSDIDPSKAKIDDIVKLPITGVRAVESAGQILFVSETGRFVFTGQLHDLWSGRPVSTMAQMHDVAERIHFRGVGMNLDELNVLSLGQGVKEVVVFVDPLCAVCHALITDARSLAGDYTFRFIVVPALGDESNRLARAVFCAQDKHGALDALVTNTIGEMVQQPRCDTAGYDRTLVAAHLLGIEGVPLIVAPDGRYSNGVPRNLKSWLEASQ